MAHSESVGDFNKGIIYTRVGRVKANPQGRVKDHGDEEWEGVPTPASADALEGQGYGCTIEKIVLSVGEDCPTVCPLVEGLEMFVMSWQSGKQGTLTSLCLSRVCEGCAGDGDTLCM